MRSGWELAAVVLPIMVVSCGGGRLHTDTARSGLEVSNTQTTVPFDEIIESPCNGDTIHFQGDLHADFHTTIDDANGRIQFDTLVNWDAISAVGDPSGETYLATGALHSHLTTGSLPISQFEIDDEVLLVAPGQANNLVVHEVFHVTVDSEGNVKVAFDKVLFACQ
jgi:hypothetical protein